MRDRQRQRDRERITLHCARLSRYCSSCVCGRHPLGDWSWLGVVSQTALAPFVVPIEFWHLLERSITVMI